MSVCVSSSLVCDGVNHCPSGEEYNSDEDPAMCARQRGFVDSNVCISFFAFFFRLLLFCCSFFVPQKRFFLFQNQSYFHETRICFHFRCHSDWAFGSKYRKNSSVNCIQRMIQRHRCQQNHHSSPRQRWAKSRREKRTKGAPIPIQKTIIRPMIIQWNHRRQNTIITWHCLEVYRNMDLGAISFLACYCVAAHCWFVCFGVKIRFYYFCPLFYFIFGENFSPFSPFPHSTNRIG